MVNPLLEQLAPIAQPLAPGWLPLAYGWWLLLVGTIALLWLGTSQWLRHRQFWAVKRRGLSQLNHANTTIEVNALLKKVAMHYFESPSINAMQGQGWSDFLSQSLTGDRESLTSIIANLYQPHTDQDLNQFKILATTWLSALSTKRIHEVDDA